MKKILLLIIITGLTATVKAQCTFPYKSLVEFSNDTTSFVTYNFSQRAVCYTGKTIQQFIADLGIAILSYVPIEEFKDRRRTLRYKSIYFYLYPYSTIIQNMHKHIFKNIIVVTLETPMDFNSFNSQRGTDYYKWNSQIENYLKGQVIKDIDIVK